MATQVQFRRGTTTENNAFTGAAAELTVDTTLTTLRVHDGTTAGGVALVNVNSAQTVTNKTFGNANTWQGNPPTLAYGGTGDSLTAVQGGLVYSTDAEMAISLAGTAGQVLTSGGTAAPIWVTPSSLTVGTASTATSAGNITGGSAGYLVYQYDTNDTRFIEPGLTGYVLQSTGASTAPEWVSPNITLGSTTVTLGNSYTGIAGLTTLAVSGTGASSSTTTGALTVAGGVGIGDDVYIGGDLNVTGDTILTGNLTVNGTTTTINSTTLTVDDLNVVLASGAADSAAANGAGITVDGANATFTYVSTGDKWSSNKPIDINGATVLTSTLSVGGDQTNTGDLAVNGGDITTTATTFNLVNDTATTVNIAGAGTTVEIGAASGTTSINNDLDVDGDVNVDGGDLTTNQTTFNVINTNATTVNAFGAASDINIGAGTSTVTFADDVEVGGNLAVTGTSTFTGQATFNGGTINLGDSASDNVVFGADVNSDIIPNTDDTYDLGSTTQEWKDLFIDGTAHIDTLDVDENATVAGTLGVTGAATLSSTLGVTGNTTVGGTLAVTGDQTNTGDLAVNGGDITTTATTFNLVNANATTVNAFGDASAVNIGNATSTTTIADDLSVVGDAAIGGNLTVTGTTTFNGGTINLGDTAGDNVVFGADVNSNIVPNTDDAYDLGSTTQEWKDLFIDGTAHIDTLDVDENATVAGTLDVTGASTFTGQVTANGGITADSGVFTVADTTGNVHTSGTLNVDGNTTVGGTLEVTGQTTMNGGITADGGVFTVADTTGNVHTSGTLDVDGNTNLDGTLQVDGAQNNSSTLTVAGLATLNGGITADGGVFTVADTTGNVHTSGTLDVDGAANFDSTVQIDSSLSVDGDATFSGNIIMDGDGYIQLDPNAAAHPSHSEGAIFYSAEYKAPTYYNDIAGISNQIGLEEWVRVKNVTGSTITNGTPVYITGASGETPTVAPADATTQSKAEVLGVATHDIANNAEGVVTTRGLVSGIDTSALTAGQRVHVGPSGALQTAAPTAPYFPTDIGTCIVSDASAGYIYVTIQEHTFEQFRVTGNTKMDGNLTVAGDLTVSGTQTITNQANLALDNAFIYMNSGDTIGEANTTFSGSGLDDAYFAGHFEGTSSTNYYVRIDGVGTGTGGVDTFEWSKDNFSTTEATGVDLAATVSLDNNITIKFNANTGHTSGDTWSGTASPLNVDTGWASNRNTGTSGVGYTHLGVMWDTASSQMIMFDAYDPEPEGNIDTNHASFNYADLRVADLTCDSISLSSGATVGGTLGVTSTLSAASGSTIGNLTLADGSITDSSGAISFGNENLSTTGTLASGALTVTGNAAISGDLQVNGGDITSSTGAISFGNENLSTTGTLSAGNSTLGTISSGAITSTGAISGTSLNVSTGAVTAGSLDISGNADIDGTMEADAYTVNGTALNEYIADTVGAMVSSNSESGISVTYQDADNTLDFDVSDFSITLTGDVTGTGTVTNLGNVSFATTIAANSVALGTDTTGAYVEDITGGTYISTSETAAGAESNVVTINHDSTTRTNTTDTGSLSHSGTFTAITSVTTNATGHVTGAETTTYTLPAGAVPNDATITLTAGTDLTTGGNFTTDQGTNETITFNHADITRTNTTSSSTASHGGTQTVVDSITTNARGHVTGVNTKTITFPEGAVPNDATITLSASTGLSGGGNFTTDQSSNETISFSLNHLGFQNLSDPNDDRIAFWDDSAGAMKWLDIGTGLSISGTTISSSASIQTTDNIQINSLGVGTAASGTTGEIRATNQITSYYSDERLKKDVAPIENAIDKVMSLRGVTYHANELAESFGFDTKEDHVGVIAQDVKAVLPEAVKPAPFDRMIFEGTEISKSGEDYMTVQYEKLVPLLIEAMKDQQKQIDELKAKLGE